jgi:plastocyanin
VSSNAGRGRPNLLLTASALVSALVLMAACAGCAGGGKVHVSGTGAPKAGVPSASASAQPAADGVQQIVIDTTDDDRFKPDVVFAHPGKLRITITNPSLLPHSFILPTLSVQSETIFAGKSVVVTVDLKDTGSYPFECGFHKHQGMVGQLIVS